METDGSRRVHPTLVWLAAYAWRLILLVAVVVGVLWLLGQLRVTFLALVVATFLSRALVPVGDWLRERGLPSAAAAAIAVLGFLLTFGTVIALIGLAVVNSAEDIGPTVSQAVDDVQEWVVEDSPFPVDREDAERFRRNIGSNVGEIMSSSTSDGGGARRVASSVFAGFEIVFAVLLGLVLTFFIVKDGHQFVDWAVGKVRPERREVTRRMGQRAWAALGGYLRGAAILGVVEGIVIALTLWLVGAELAVPMGTLTLIAAFIPFLGAVVAGVLSVLVALATAGLTAAVIVAVVAVAVQQLDNDILAPWIYGKALSMHPVVILLAITAGGGLFGLAGTFLAVPVTAVIMNVWTTARDDPDMELVGDRRADS